MENCPDCGNALTQIEVEDRQRFYCEECSRVIWQNPKPVAWLLLQKDDRYLLVKRADEPDKGEWDIPGGFLELEESFSRAAVRELEEETGVKVREDRIELFDTVAFDRADEHVVGTVFCAEIQNTPDIEPSDDAAEAKFWRLEELRSSDEETLRDVCGKLLD